MQVRIFSWGAAFLAASLSFTATASHAWAEDSSGFVTDPATGNVYRPVTRTIDRPVVETQIRKEERTMYRPETVTDTQTETRVLYSPVVEYRWEPRLHGRWNPFQPATVAYHHVPTSRWETRTETVPRTTTRTHWVEEKRTVDVPYRVSRMQRETRTDHEYVGNVRTSLPANLPGNLAPQIAARLRPLDPNVNVPSQMSAAATGAWPASQLASDSTGRTTSWGGIKATELQPSYNPAFAAPALTSGVAGLPILQMWR